MLNKKISVNSSVITRTIIGETILVPIHQEMADLQKLYYLDPVGEFIWGKLDGTVPLNRIAHEVCENFDVSASQAEIDCVEFLEELLEQQLVEIK